MGDFEEVNENEKPLASNRRFTRHAMSLYENGTDLRVRMGVDHITMVDYLKLDKLQEFVDFLSVDTYINILNSEDAKIIKARVVDESAYIEVHATKLYVRVEFNPAKIDKIQRQFIFNNLVKKIPGYHFSRVDVALDLNLDLKDFFMYTDTPLKYAGYYSAVGVLETKYFGTRKSARYLRIYNKALERKENAKDGEEPEIFVPGQPWWRVEAELKRSWIDDWQKSFSDLHMVKSSWKDLPDVRDRSMVCLLLNEPDEWGKIERRTRNKYRELINKTSDIDLNLIFDEAMQLNKNKILSELNYWIVPGTIRI